MSYILYTLREIKHIESCFNNLINIFDIVAVTRKVSTIMGVVKRTLSKAIRNWEARRLMTAHNAGVSRKKQLERVWPHPLTTEKRHELAQGVSGLVHSEN
mgnify:FL=1